LNPRRLTCSRTETILALLWVIAVAGMGLHLLLSLQSPAILGLLIGIACFAYIAALIWHLSHAGQPATDLPSLQPILLSKLSFWKMLGAIITLLGLLFTIGILIHPWIILGAAFSIISLWIIVAWRRKLSKKTVILGLAAGLISGLLTRYVGTGDLGMTLFYLATVPPQFIGGALLLHHTGLTCIRLLLGQYALGLRGFLWASMLAIPPAILNILGGPNADDLWVNHWWQPLYSLVPGIAEETVARLFLTTLCYALLRPTTNDHPRRATIASVLIGALTHGLAHLYIFQILSPAGIMMIIMGLMYGVPMALLFIKRDLEHAIGYHFFIDFIRYLAALFWL